MTEKWWHKSVVYQIYPRSFYDSNGDGIGDIQGILQHIDYIKKLGVDVIWLCPVYDSPNDDNGYDIRNYEAIMSEFGTMSDLENLIRECEKRDIKIIMDLVVNHTSDEHFWFKEAKKSKDNPYHDFYIWTDSPNELKSNFGGSAWEYVEELDQYYLHFYSKKQPDLNWKNENMRKEIYKMMNFWLDKGISGFRMDVIDLIGKEPEKLIKENGPKLHYYINEMYNNTYGKKDLLTVGETWGATIDNAGLFCNPERNELSMIFQFEQIQLDKEKGKHRWDIKKLDLVELKEVLSKWQYAMEDKGWNSLFWNNHDLPRIVSRWGNDKEYRKECAKMFGTLLHGMKGTPYIYQGEEIGMTNFYSDNIEDYPDIETQNVYKERIEQGFNKEDIMHSIHIKARDNARTPMQWNDSENGGFTTGKPWMKVNENYKYINVNENLNDENSIFYHYQKLIKLRKNNKVIQYGKYILLDENNPSVYAYKRVLDDKSIVVICNFYEKPVTFELDGIEKFNVVLNSYKDTNIETGKIHLRSYEAVILEN